ncbi:hypothetical protein ILYODFUR_034070 [Ilyodon furcidens]|uniref:Uncharacterized protein n=1 Tax=Ilyodon furcidens TaxID=33524 RepID=A0ABV0UXG5_9TELE
MFRCGIDYRRCKCIMPLLVLFAIIFDIIAIAANSGWVEDENQESHYASMWQECRSRNNKWECKSLMDSGKCFRHTQPADPVFELLSDNQKLQAGWSREACRQAGRQSELSSLLCKKHFFFYLSTLIHNRKGRF